MELFKYIKHPTFCKATKPQVGDLLFLFALYFIIALCIVPVIAIVKRFTGVEDIVFMKDAKTIFKVILLGPILEEVLFRLWLKPSKINYYFLLIALLISITTNFVRGTYCFSIVFALVLVVVLCLRFIDKIRFATFYKENFKYFFWFSVLCFGLLHATNYHGSWLTILLCAPILGLPQVVMGGILGYTRMKYGFIYGLILHVSINAFFFLFYFCAK